MKWLLTDFDDLCLEWRKSNGRYIPTKKKYGAKNGTHFTNLNFKIHFFLIYE